MARDIHLQPAYLLHSRPFRDTSLLLDFLTRDYGRISAVARGVRTPKSPHKGLLQLFTPLQVSFAGRHELKTLRNVELLAEVQILKGQRLFSALYMNELLVRLVHGREAEAPLFDAYEETLARLAGEELEAVLRGFELTLLEALGYGIAFEGDAATGEVLAAEGWYHFEAESGFIRVAAPGEAEVRERRYYPGEALIAIGRHDFSDPDTRRVAKRLLRGALGHHLGDRPLLSRALFKR